MLFTAAFLGIGSFILPSFVLGKDPAPAVKAPADFYGFRKTISLEDAIASFNSKYHADALLANEPDLQEEELICALLIASQSLSSSKSAVLENAIRTNTLPVGSKFRVQTESTLELNGTSRTLRFWKVDLQFGIVAPKDTTRELIPTDKEMSLRWTIPVRVKFIR